MARRHTVRFYLNGERQDVTPRTPTLTLLQYLREERRLTGTKEGCAEGDCGACTVMEAGLAPDGSVDFHSINACIRLLPAVDGRCLWTVEAMCPRGAPLHPVQQALVDHHGSQCGFCTPGFVMSLVALQQQSRERPTRAQVLEHLSGNLCRCTGYRPIIDAAMHAGLDAYRAVDAHEVAAQLRRLREACRIPLVLDAAGQHYHAPRDSAAFADAYVAHPDAVILAGGTDVGLWVTKQLKPLAHVIHLGDVADLQGIDEQDGWLRIAAAVPLNPGYRAIVERYPEADELWKRFASMPIRNAGTLVGNLANGSPIGDSAPLLIALGSRVVLRRGDSRRQLPLEALYLDYRRQDRQAGEFLEFLLVPPRPAGQRVAAYKLAKRFDQDISAVCAAYALTLDDGGVVTGARVAHGGLAATSRRAPSVERALIGQAWNEATVLSAMAALAEDYQPMTDMRASSSYRLKAAQNLLLRFYLDTMGRDAVRVPSPYAESGGAAHAS